MNRPLRFADESEAEKFLTDRLAEGKGGYVVNGSHGWLVCTPIEGSDFVWAYYTTDRAVSLPSW